MDPVAIFPSTRLLDDFNHPDEDPIVTRWTTPAFSGDPSQETISNQLGGRGTTAYYDIEQFDQNQEAWGTIGALPPDGFNMSIRLRLQGVGGASATNYSFNFISGVISAGVWSTSISGVKNGTSLGNLTGDVQITTPIVGDKFGARAVDSTLTAWLFHGGVWTPVATATDSQITGPGYVGTAHDSAAIRWEDFGGGAVVAPRLYWTRQKARRGRRFTTLAK